MLYTVYRAKNIKTGKSYIGFDSNWPKRMYQHLYWSTNREDGMYFHRAIRKYGSDNFVWEVLFEGSDREEALKDVEPFFIKFFDTLNNGYNLTSGGDGITGYRHTNETKQILSKKAKIQMTENPIRYWEGKNRSEETKRKISKTKLGTIQTEEHKLKNSTAIKDKWKDPVWRSNMLRIRKENKDKRSANV